MNLSEEERQRRSEAARELVRQGKIGGPRPGSGRPRKPRASEIIAEEVRARADDIKTALFDGLGAGVPQTVRNDSAKTLLAIEQREHENEREEVRNLERLHRDELIAGVAQRLERLAASGRIALPDVDGTARAIPQRASD